LYNENIQVYKITFNICISKNYENTTATNPRTALSRARAAAEVFIAVGKGQLGKAGERQGKDLQLPKKKKNNNQDFTATFTDHEYSTPIFF
jgi:hypothetical protein